MKVLHINCNYLGTALHKNLIKYLEKKSVKNDVFVPVYKNVDIKLFENNIFVEKCFNKKDRFIFDYKQKKIIKRVNNRMNIYDYNIIHAHTLFTDGNVAMKLSKKYNIPYVVAIRNTDVNYFLKKLFFLRRRGVKIMKNASAIMFLSSAYKKQVFDKYVSIKDKEYLEKKSYIIPNGIDDFWFKNKKINIEDNIKYKVNKQKEGNINILYVGKIDKNKNIETTIEALKILKNKKYNVSFYVIGNIKDEEIYNRIVKHEFVTYIEAQPMQNLPKYYNKSDIFVMPSKTETFGLVYVESMSQGVPVIYTKGQGFDEQFPEGEIGYHVSCTDSMEIANKIQLIINNYKYLSNNCIKNINKYNWDNISDKYIKIYSKIIIQ